MIKTPKPNQAYGFTIIEVIIVISIVSIMLIIAIPNMSKMLEANQATQQSHDFISAIQLSVSEADKKDSSITICAKKVASNECVNYTNSPSDDLWRNGWLLFTDTQNNGTFNPGSGDVLIKSQVNGHNKINVKAVSSAVTIATGGVITRGDGNYFFSPAAYSGDHNCHRVSVYKTGQLSIKGGVCP